AQQLSVGKVLAPGFGHRPVRLDEDWPAFRLLDAQPELRGKVVKHLPGAGRDTLTRHGCCRLSAAPGRRDSPMPPFPASDAAAGLDPDLVTEYRAADSC